MQDRAGVDRRYCASRLIVIRRTAVWAGVIYLIGRMIYFMSYVKDPKSRSAGYGLSALPVIVLLVGTIVGAIRAAVLTM